MIRESITMRINNNKVIGGAQDNGTTRNIGGSGSDFEQVYGGNSGSVGLSDPAATGGVQYEYVSTENGVIIRRNAADGNGVGTNITPTGESGGLFVTLFKLDPDNTETLYYANKNHLYQTTSASTVTPDTWTRMTGIETAVGNANITTVSLTSGAYNPATSSLFLGTQDGKVFRLDDPTGTAVAAAAAPPVNITGANFPAGAYVSSIALNPTNDDTALVTFSNYNVASVFWTTQANAAAPAWTNVENNLPLPSYRSSAIVNIGGNLEYYVGTSAGLYRITGLPAAGTWTQESPAMIGNAVVNSLDLRVADNKLLVGTHGIGMFSSSAAPTAAGVAISGRVLIGRRGLRNATVYLTNQNGETLASRTTAFGYYHFDDITAGQTVILTVVSKRYQFAPQVVSLTDDLTNFNFNFDQSPTVWQGGLNDTNFQKSRISK